MVTYLGKLGELTLKKTNIHSFEVLLSRNAKMALRETDAKIRVAGGRLYVECSEEYSSIAETALSHLIGITGWAKATVCEKNIDDIKKAVFEVAKKAKENGAASFKIEAKRADKSFPLNSYKIACEAASPVFDSSLLKVDVKNPDAIIYVEVRQKCFVYSDDKKSCRGLPVGSSGKGLLLLSGGLDSPVAGYRMMRRGMKIECCYFHSFPYTSDEAQKKVQDLAKTLSFFEGQLFLNVVSLTDVQMKIKKSSPEAWTTMILRVCMMKVANMIAERIGADCIVTGESLGQVASQTIENLKVTEHFATFPLIRPLVGMDKEEIIKDAKFIGTYDTSILPYEDCCVLFSPRHPVLRARIEDAEKIYESLEIDELLKQSYETRKIMKFVGGEDCSI